jgi:hypothetical protein
VSRCDRLAQRAHAATPTVENWAFADHQLPLTAKSLSRGWRILSLTSHHRAVVHSSENPPGADRK